MHEMSIAANIVDILNEVIEKRQIKAVEKVYVQIGELIAVVPESLRFCYLAITDNTSLEGSELDISIIPATLYCQACGSTFQNGLLNFTCSICGSTRVEEISGRELVVKSLECS